MTSLELLSPAKNLECGIAAINSGADAIYIGAPKFGARINAGNDLGLIEKLIKYGHRFRVKTYVAINTLFYDNEIDEIEKLIHHVYNIGADAIIIQDMGILELNLPPIPLIASTQCHNSSVEKVKFLEKVGFKRVILARELSLNQIIEIRKNSSIELEFFIHGALCVCYSGQCYFSHAITKKSANRGECTQPCRMTYNLIDSKGNIIVKDKHLLSLKDFDLSKYLSELISIGITSFKIEGRLKDVDYVTNITAYYRKKIDEVISKNNNLTKSSVGNTTISFTPNINKSFNRGFSDYFIHSRNSDMISFDTSKSIGEKIGIIKTIKSDYFIVKENHDLHNGDGICFFNKDKILLGTNINKVMDEKVFPNDISELFVGSIIYRNYDLEFIKSMKNNPPIRKINIELEFGETEDGFYLIAKDPDFNEARYEIHAEKIIASNKKLASDTVRKQLSKMGDTIYNVCGINIITIEIYFINISTLNKIRREVIALLDLVREKKYRRDEKIIEPNDYPYPEKFLDYKSNIANKKAKSFYERHQAHVKENAFELTENIESKTIMTTKYCIKYQIKACPKISNYPEINLKEPLFLENNKKMYRLEFDCSNCVMNITLE